METDPPSHDEPGSDPEPGASWLFGGGHGLPERIGPYRILEQIGEGGMGVVYLAEQREPVRRRVALKLIKLGMDTKRVIARFEAERQALALLTHPNIAVVHDAGSTEDGRPYFAMEYIEGLPITRFCDEHRLGIRARLRLFLQVCGAVEHAHRHGIIHRDIKPSNILVALIGSEPIAKVIDFGLARATNQRLTERTLYTERGCVVGTPAYMSPEQTVGTGESVDHRSDVYSLGALLYELIVGQLPIDLEVQTAAYDEVIRRIREEEPRTPSLRWSSLNIERSSDLAAKRGVSPAALRLAIRGDLDWICMKCLAKERTRRYAGAGDLAADIERHLRSEPVHAGPPSALYRMRRFVRRNRPMVLATGAVVIVLLAGLIATMTMTALSMYSRAFRESERRRTEADAAKGREASRSAELAAALETSERNLRRATSFRLTTLSGEERARNPGRALLLAVAASEELRTAEGDAALQASLLDLQEEKAVYIARSWVKVGGYSPGRDRLVAYSGDHRAHVLDAVTGRALATMEGHSAEILSAAFSPDGRLVLTASKDRTARVWEAANGTPVHVLRGHGDVVVSAASSPDGTRILTQSWDGTARLWDMSSGRELHAFLSKDGAKFSPDGARILSIVGEGAELHDAETAELLRTFAPHPRELHPAEFSRDGRFIITASWDSDLRVWDAAAPDGAAPLWTTSVEQWSGWQSADGKIVVQQAIDDALEVWSIEKGVRLSRLLGLQTFCYAADFSPDGRHLVTSLRAATARIWDAETGNVLVDLGEKPSPASMVRYSPRGDLILAAMGATARVWRASGQPVATGAHPTFDDGIRTYDDARRRW